MYAKSKNDSEPTFYCEKHINKALEFYCRKEEQYICGKCFDVHLNHADKIEHIDNFGKYVRGIAQNLIDEIHLVQLELEKCMISLTKIKNNERTSSEVLMSTFKNGVALLTEPMPNLYIARIENLIKFEEYLNEDPE